MELLNVRVLKQVSTSKSRPTLLTQRLLTLVTMSTPMPNATVFMIFRMQQPQMVWQILTVIQEASHKPYLTLFCLLWRFKYQESQQVSV